MDDGVFFSSSRHAIEPETFVYSQFHKAPISDPETGKDYICGEQPYQMTKAEYIKKHRCQKGTKKDKYPEVTADNLSIAVFDERTSAIRMAEMTREFHQNRDERDWLLSTGSAQIYEARATDFHCGIGYTADVAKKTPRSQWGQNLLGKAIMKARDRIRREILLDPDCYAGYDTRAGAHRLLEKQRAPARKVERAMAGLGARIRPPGAQRERTMFARKQRGDMPSDAAAAEFASMKAAFEALKRSGKSTLQMEIDFMKAEHAERSRVSKLEVDDDLPATTMPWSRRFSNRDRDGEDDEDSSWDWPPELDSPVSPDRGTRRRNRADQSREIGAIFATGQVSEASSSSADFLSMSTAEETNRKATHVSSPTNLGAALSKAVREQRFPTQSQQAIPPAARTLRRPLQITTGAVRNHGGASVEGEHALASSARRRGPTLGRLLGLEPSSPGRKSPAADASLKRKRSDYQPSSVSTFFPKLAKVNAPATAKTEAEEPSTKHQRKAVRSHRDYTPSNPKMFGFR
ncbi:hypothetical protein LTR36_006027 [Oleoguttula mirabilis]|uniref:NADAR domain-containing protein n=1 Tax=Oleoguttula mirabilis TaxID=1507867 RepID=A0AAV9JCR5_9PEZI|nr:hypothetical protein LTR36_006027 [Oleoguttula mirabilis]